MADSAITRLLVQASHYGVVSLFTLIAGLVIFPLLTRLFSVEDYGVLNLVAATLTIFVAVGKVGVQHSPCAVDRRRQEPLFAGPAVLDDAVRDASERDRRGRAAHLAPSEIMRRIKGRTSSYLFQEFPHVKKRYWGWH